MRAFIVGVCCIIALHSPDGTALLFESRNLTALRALPPGYKEHVVPGTKTIVYGSGGNKFGVVEVTDDIAALISKCSDDGRKIGDLKYGKR